MRILTAALSALLLAGCLSPTITTSAPQTPSEEPLVFEDCSEHHAFFILPKASFADVVPPGFTVVSDGATTTLLVAGQLCRQISRSGERETSVGDIIAYLSVVAPEELRDENISGDMLMLGGVTNSRAEAAWAVEHGFAEVLQAGQLGSQQGLAGGITFTAKAAGHDVTLTTTPHEGSGKVDALQWRAFVAREKQVLGVVTYTNAESDDAGLGQAAITWSGSASPLPGEAWPGGDHGLEHVNVEATYRSIGG